MSNTKSIKISSVRASDNKLQVELEISEEISKYFFKNSFEVTYDKNIENVDESILTIPAVCAVVQIAWAIGAELYVEKLDETFLSSLSKIRKVFEGFYPKFSFSGDIHVQKIIANKFNNKRTALLFSGGLDSIVSYIMHKDEHPILITLLKTGNSNYNKIKDFHIKFAEQEGVEIHFIEGNMWEDDSDTINIQLLKSEFEIVTWWGKVSHGLIIWGLCAPLAVEKIGKIIFASTYTKNYNLPQGSHFLINTGFSWADIDVFYDSILSRQKKIQFLKPTSHYLQNLLVCFFPGRSSERRNCGVCEKCLRTITGFILEGIDPNEFNFNIKNNVFDYIKNLIIAEPPYEEPFFWQDIQSNIPDTINEDEISQRYHAKQFFEWLRDYEFPNPDYKKRVRFFIKLKYLYHCLKYRGIDFTIKKILRTSGKKFQQ